MDCYKRIEVSRVKDTLWVLRRDEPLVHVSDISLITEHILVMIYP